MPGGLGTGIVNSSSSPWIIVQFDSGPRKRKRLLLSPPLFLATENPCKCYEQLEMAHLEKRGLCVQFLGPNHNRVHFQVEGCDLGLTLSLNIALASGMCLSEGQFLSSWNRVHCVNHDQSVLSELA